MTEQESATIHKYEAALRVIDDVVRDRDTKVATLHEQIDSLQAQRDEAVAACAGMREALEDALAIIKHWRDKAEAHDDAMVEWGTYFNKSPVMRAVRQALSTSLGAFILQRQKEQDAALAQMRGALEAILDCRVSIEDEDGNPQYVELRLTREVRLAVSKALSPSLGASTLEYIRGLEGLLQDLFDAWNDDDDAPAMPGTRWGDLYGRIYAHLKGAGK